MASEGNYEVSLTVPLTSDREAKICYDVLRVDGEPPRSKVTRKLECDKNIISAKLSSVDIRQLRVSLTSFLDHLQLVIQTLHEFGPPVSKNYDFYTGTK